MGKCASAGICTKASSLRTVPGSFPKAPWRSFRMGLQVSELARAERPELKNITLNANYDTRVGTALLLWLGRV